MTIFLIFCIESTFGQNIVANGSFEDYSSCPDLWTDWSQAQISKSAGWYIPTLGTTDFFHVCGTNGASIPNTMFGYMNPDNIMDSAFAGMETYSANPAAVREYMAYDISPLTIGTLYHVTLKIVPSPNSSLYTDCFGVYFLTSTNVIDRNSQRIIVNPQINYENFGIQSDSTWKMLTGNFIADSAYTKIMVGCFEHTDSVGVIYPYPNLTNPFQYYLYDEICISSNINDCIQTTGILGNANNDGIAIYPNPTNGEININLGNHNSADDGDLIISDVVGNKIYQGKTHLGNNNVNIESYPKGIYFLTIFIGGNHYMKKIFLD